MTGVPRQWEGPCRLATATGVAALLLCGAVPGGERSAKGASTMVVSLDGEWLLGTDPQDVGRGGHWFRSPRPEAKRTRVPWIIQDAFPGYHGVAWYWRTFEAPANPHEGGRCLLRFWQVDYKADVWLNDAHIGEHEGGESVFTFDVTDAIKPGARNRLAVRVLNPTHEPIDGIVLNETAHRNKSVPYRAGMAWNQGGIMDSVELLVAPAVRVADLFVRGDWKTGTIRIQATVHNASARALASRLELSAAPAASGETIAASALHHELPPGDSLVEAELRVENPRLWELGDPFLYRVTARATVEGSPSFDEHSVRCGFRDFRFERGWFRLNGRRAFLRCSHTGNCCPVGLELPHDPDLLRRDLLNVKAMRFNAIRFIAGVAKRRQLDLCDELGLMVYEESYAAWMLGDSPRMAERYDESVIGMVRRDRNHPSVVIWGLLNETPEGPVFRHAAGALPRLRQLDDSRMVMLNSGRWDNPGGSIDGLQVWRNRGREDPCVTRNGTGHVIQALGITWQPSQLALHPGRNGEYGVVRWSAPQAGKAEVKAAFETIAKKATTDVHVLHNGKALFDAFINLRGQGPEARFAATVAVREGDTIDCAVGYGNGDYGADTTALAVTVQSAGKTHNTAADFAVTRNPNGAWSYGQMAPGERPDAKTFAPFPEGRTLEALGGLSNPGSSRWENLLHDQHPYPRVPHTADTIQMFRTLSGGGRPVFISEYGIGSAVHLPRVVRLYEQIGKGEADDARFYRALRDRFMADWERWRMAEAFASPDDYFAQCLAKMAGQRLLGLNAIRANPHCIGYSLTGTVDQGMTAEGLTTTFRELKPGTVDALFDGFAPLRWCLFAEPVNAYRGARVRVEAVLANEDALRPGDYPARFQVVAPDMTRVLDRTLTVTVPEPQDGREPAMVLPVLAEEVAIGGPPGRYRFVASFEQGAAAAGGETVFHVADATDMPAVETEVVLCGEDAGLAKWLSDRGIRTRAFSPDPPKRREVILIGRGAPGDAEAWRALARRIARGSTAVFLCHEVFRKGDDPVGWVPLERKGALDARRSWLYLKDEWAKRHPIFDGLPAGGLLDLTFYRELIPDHTWAGQQPPAEAVAGAINAAQDYSSGLMVAVHELGAGRFILNTMRVREELGRHPAAERLLRNLLRHAARDAGKLLADLPDDFDATLKTLGYLE